VQHPMYIRLASEEVAALAKLADVERRSHRDQAALLIIEGLRERGLLAPSEAAPVVSVAPAPGPRDA
jgi:hypothetical protein